jgi:hypothetical protein
MEIGFSTKIGAAHVNNAALSNKFLFHYDAGQSTCLLG